jgi:hypothetical protein
MGCRAPKVITNLLSILLHTMKRSNSHRQATRVTFPCITQFEGHGITTYRHQSLHRQLMPHRQLDFCEAPLGKTKSGKPPKLFREKADSTIA